MECVFARVSELGKLGFGNTLEILDTIDVVVSPGKFIVAMVDAEVLVVSYFDFAG